MNKQADFRQEKALRDLWLKEQIQSSALEHRKTQRELIKQIMKLSLQEQIPDHSRRKKLETEYYNLLYSIAQENGGRVELDIDENLLFGALTYWGTELTMDGAFYPKLNELTELMNDCDTVSISAEGFYFKLQLSFDLTCKDPEHSHSPEIQTLTAQLMETFKDFPSE